MQDDNPLWYDDAEPDAAPSRALLIAADLLDVTLSGIRALVRVYVLPDRIWCRAADAVAKYRTPGARRT